MGVIYKLKPEVIDFILRQKRDVPSLSCRRLSILVEERFSVEISKSSINTILKKASLSSPIGRRSSGKKKKVKPFEIPKDKKAEISKAFQSFDQDSPNVSQDTGNKEDMEDSILMEESSGLEEAKIEPEVVGEVPLSETLKIPEALEPIPEGTLLKDIKGIKDAHLSSFGFERAGTGIIFLKAAFDQLDGSNFARILEKYVPLLPEKFSQLIEALVLLGIKDKNAMEHLDEYEEHAVWKLLDVNFPSKEDLAALSLAPENLTKASFDLDSLKSQMALKICSFRVILDDKTEIILDPRLATLWNSSPPYDLSWPLEQAVASISTYVISNNEPLCLLAPSNEYTFRNDFLNLISLFGRKGERTIERIEVLDDSGDLVTDFSMIPQQKRMWIAGIWLEQKEIKDLIKNTRFATQEPFYHAPLNKIMYFSDTKTDLFTSFGVSLDQELRIITLWEDVQNEPIGVLLSNHHKVTSKTIIEGFISRWPGFNKGQSGLALTDQHNQERDNVLQSQKEGCQSPESLWELILIFGDFVKEHFEQNFVLEKNDLHINDYIAIVCDFNGKFYQSDQSMFVHISSGNVLPKTSQMVKLINESLIRNFDRKQLVLSLENESSSI